MQADPEGCEAASQGCQVTRLVENTRKWILPETLPKDPALPTARFIHGDLFGTFCLPELKGKESVLSSKPLSLRGCGCSHRPGPHLSAGDTISPGPASQCPIRECGLPYRPGLCAAVHHLGPGGGRLCPSSDSYCLNGQGPCRATWACCRVLSRSGPDSEQGSSGLLCKGALGGYMASKNLTLTTHAVSHLFLTVGGPWCNRVSSPLDTPRNLENRADGCYLQSRKCSSLGRGAG